MFEKTPEDLAAELSRLQYHEMECDRLINLIEDGTQDLDLSADMETITLASLNVLSDTIAQKIGALNNLIEAVENQSLDRFRRREIK